MNDLDIRQEWMNDHFLKVHIPGLGVLHRFTAADGPDAEFHDHPFAADIVILKGGYAEQRLVQRYGTVTIDTLYRYRGDEFTNRAGHIHRIVELHEPEVWTLFQPGQHERKSGFYRMAGDGRELLHRFWDEDEFTLSDPDSVASPDDTPAPPTPAEPAGDALLRLVEAAWDHIEAFCVIEDSGQLSSRRAMEAALAPFTDAALAAAPEPQPAPPTPAEPVGDALREALEPFVKHYAPWMERLADDDDLPVYPRHTMGDLRRARAALAAAPASQPVITDREALVEVIASRPLKEK